MTEQEILQRNEYLRTEYPELFVALNYHRTHKNEMLSFVRMPFLRQIYIDKADYAVYKKCTQMGLSEYLILRSLIASATGRGVFYVLPTGNLVGRFVKNRIDRSIEFTPFYRQLVKVNPARFAESVSLKHFGKGSIAFIGSNASAGFTEYPADDLVIDELDECDQGNLAMAGERLSASAHKRIIKVGNPTILNFGIDTEFNKSDKKEWHIRCSSCNTRQALDFFSNVVKEVGPREFVVLDDAWDRKSGKDIRPVCRKCGKPLDRLSDGEWVKGAESEISGYHINKLYAPNVTIKELVERFDEGLTDDTKLQRFYNGDLGQAYTSSGSKLNYEMLHACKANYGLQEGSKKPCVIGVDVGSKLHTVVLEVRPDKTTPLVYAGMLNSREDILDLCRRFNIRFGVIDAMPEQRLSKGLVSSIPGLFSCFYGKDVKSEKVNTEERYIVVDRTASLDAVREAVLLKSLLLPRNADKMAPLATDGMSEFFFEMCTSTRIFSDVRKSYSWAEGGSPDHFFHAVNYALIAVRLFLRAGRRG